MPPEEVKSPMEVKDLYKTLLDTRNLEINLFWQRSNYFLVLNTSIAFGFFNLKDEKFAVIFAAMGLLVSVLWFLVCLGILFKTHTPSENTPNLTCGSRGHEAAAIGH